MKFIKTKDGIYEVVDTYEVKYVIGYTEDGFEISIYKENGITEANTLEELCDLYIDEETKTIFHKYNGNKYVINWKTNLVYSFKDLVKVFPNVKGAIYTDKGLIYVTKLNEEGKSWLI